VPGTFTHAVASFDPTSSAVLLWTRLAEVTDLISAFLRELDR